MAQFHIGIPWAYSVEAGFGVLLNNPGDGTVNISVSGAMDWQLVAQQQLDFWITTTATATPDAATSSRVVGGAATIYKQYADAVGHAPPLPAYAALFWQCRLRYRTAKIAQDIAAGYQQRNLSLGVLVVDFMNQATDGDMHMNPKCYGTGREITDWVKNISTMGGGQTRTMLSFWPDIRSDSDGFSALNAAGCVHDGTVDPTSKHCRDLIWQNYVKPNYVDHGIMDFWLDEDDMVRTTQRKSVATGA